MALTRRYEPPHAAGERVSFGMDFSQVIPEGIGITTSSLAIFTNTQPPIAADADWSTGSSYTRGRAAFQILSGGKDGVDYLLQWTVTDTRSNIWVRTALILCAATS